MSLFQCDKCGCLENTSLTEGYWTGNEYIKGKPEYQSYRDKLGLAEGQPWGHYCSACNPRGDGQWHGKFARLFLPKGLFHTNEDGNLAHIETLDTDVDKYALPAEEALTLPRYYVRMDDRLPRPSNTAECQRYLKHVGIMLEGLKKVPEHLTPSEGDRRAVMVKFAADAVKLNRELEDAKELRRAKHARGNTFAAMAAGMALAATGFAHEPRRSRPEPEPRVVSKEDKVRWAAQEQAKLAKAIAKRERRSKR
jgi:hypothetical protein